VRLGMQLCFGAAADLVLAPIGDCFWGWPRLGGVLCSCRAVGEGRNTSILHNVS
jgi:hypothetical protein